MNDPLLSFENEIIQLVSIKGPGHHHSHTADCLLLHFKDPNEAQRIYERLVEISPQVIELKASHLDSDPHLEDTQETEMFDLPESD